MAQTSIVVTSINGPNKALRQFASGATENGASFTVVGDVPSPADFRLEGCRFIGIDDQLKSGLRFARACPTRHYARKNIGYLLEMSRGAEIIIDTDDDNLPYDSFWTPRTRDLTAPTVDLPGWLNVYGYFTDALIWPRGLPLDSVQPAVPPFESLQQLTHTAPIQQGLANDNPDVDAIYRLILPLSISFRTDRTVVLANGVWCPFNSQNTTWFREAFPLLYLPAYCSFRMTDIWRSFVAQRIGWENDWHIVFHGPTVWQERNDHKLMRDFEDEIPGYLNNRRMAEALENLSLHKGFDSLGDNLRICYQCLVREGWVGKMELDLLECWLADLKDVAM